MKRWNLIGASATALGSSLCFSTQALSAPYFNPVENYTQAQSNYVLNVARNGCRHFKLAVPKDETYKDIAVFTKRLPYQRQLMAWIDSENATKAIMEVSKRLDRNCNISKHKFQTTLWRIPKFFD